LEVSKSKNSKNRTSGRGNLGKCFREQLFHIPIGYRYKAYKAHHRHTPGPSPYSYMGQAQNITSREAHLLFSH
jgi:hypothetical protein